MRLTFSFTVPLVLLAALAAVQLDVARLQAQLPPCAFTNCGAGQFADGGHDGTKSCSSGACWWNDCTQRAGNPCVVSRTQHCSNIGPLGCLNEPCTGQLGSCNSDSDCCHPYFCNADSRCAQSSPVMINLRNASSNFHLTSYTNGVLFDINATGRPILVGWTEAESLIGLLALDRDGNGTIDDGSELFGTVTRKSDGSLAEHGFDALLDLDGGHGVSDGRIDTSDVIYASLRLWFDDNHDGVSQSRELRSLADTGVVSLSLDYRETPRMDRHGNWYRYEGTAIVLKEGRERWHRMFDVFPITAAPLQ